MGAGAERLSTARGFDSESGQHCEWRGEFREIDANGSNECARERGSGAIGSEQSADGRGAVATISGSAGTTEQCLVAFARGSGALSGAEGEPEFPDVAGAA